MRICLFVLLAALALVLAPAHEARADFTIGDGNCGGTSKTSSTSVSCTVSGTWGAGNLGVMWFAADNIPTTDVTTSPIASITDPGSNTWTVQGCYTNGRGASASGATVCVATSVLATGFSSGSVTVNLNNAVIAKGIRVREFNMATGSDIALVGGPINGAVDNGDAPLLQISGLTSGIPYLWIRADALEVATAAYTATGGFTSVTCVNTTGTPAAGNMAACGEYSIVALTGQNSDPASADVDIASIYFAFREVSRIVIGNGTNPADATVGPQSGIVDLDGFTLRASLTAVDVTGLTVTLTGANSFESVQEVRITTSADAQRFDVVSNPASNTVVFSGGTPIAATTSDVDYKVRITPRNHDGSPGTPPGLWPPAGLAYAVTGTVTGVTTASPAQTMTGTDTSSATITVDNASPANVTGSPSCSAGAVQSTIGTWTNPGADYNSTVVVRNTSALTVDTPVEGTTYAANDVFGANNTRVVCVGNITSCADTGATNLAPGTSYYYKIFTRDAFANYSANGVVPSGLPCTTTLSSFNVVEVNGHPVTGVLKTKIAGADISAQIVVRDSGNGLLTDFDKQVTLELVDGTGGTACNLRTQVKALSAHTFAAGTGRKTLDAAQFESNSHKDLRFRVTYTQGGTTITSCSVDNFANRPNAFASVEARDANRTTAGATNLLNNTSNPGTGNVHNAGRPFRIVATAMNGAGSPIATTNYDPDAGQPVATVSQCGVANVCSATLGTLTTTSGDFSHSNGVITSDTATYSNVGAISVVLQDKTFANVDLADSSDAERWIQSGTVTFGRFVPDHFAVTGATLTPRTDIGACSGSSFTYMDETLSLAFTLTARAFGGATTTAYAGATLGALNVGSIASFGLGARSGTTNLSSRLDTGGTPSGSWAAGVAAMTAVPTMLRRATPDNPDGPYAATSIGIAPSDPDGVIMESYDLDVDGAGGNDHTSVGTHEFRYGRLRVQGAMGSEKLALALPMEVQHWSGGGFVRNTADSCTTLGRDAIALSFVPASNLSNTDCETAFSAATLTASSGLIAASLVAPTTGNNGTVLVTPQLRPASVSGSSCSAKGAAPTAIPGTIPSRAYLMGRWNDAANPDANANTMYDDNPSGRAAFGVYGSQPSQFIYFRENH